LGKGIHVWQGIRCVPASLPDQHFRVDSTLKQREACLDLAVQVDLAIVLRRAGRLPEAEALFKEALKALDVPGKEPTCSLASVQVGAVL
jgi:hypothetical protein